MLFSLVTLFSTNKKAGREKHQITNNHYVVVVQLLTQCSRQDHPHCSPILNQTNQFKSVYKHL